MHCIVDSDTIAFACAASAEEHDNPGFAIARSQTMVDTILRDTNATTYELWLSGKDNFRYGVYPEYKANRIGAYRPKWEQSVKEYLTSSWGAKWSEEGEADDMVGVRLVEWGDKAIVAHLDKDINMIPGWHYNWAINRLGVCIREPQTYYVSLEEADRCFWTQLIVGDTTDNIKGVPGLGPKKAAALLRDTDNQSAYKVCQDVYACEEELDMSAQCVYIWRKMNDNWRNLIEQ